MSDRAAVGSGSQGVGVCQVDSSSQSTSPLLRPVGLRRSRRPLLTHRRARTRMPFAVARMVGVPPGSASLAPLSRPVTFPPAPSRNQRLAPVNRFVVPWLMTPTKMTFPRADRDRTTVQQSPRVADRTRWASCLGVPCADVPTPVPEAVAAGAEAVVRGAETRTSWCFPLTTRYPRTPMAQSPRTKTSRSSFVSGTLSDGSQLGGCYRVSACCTRRAWRALVQ